MQSSLSQGSIAERATTGFVSLLPCSCARVLPSIVNAALSQFSVDSVNVKINDKDDDEIDAVARTT